MWCFALLFFFFVFFNDTATTEIYTLSLHDALPISRRDERRGGALQGLYEAHDRLDPVRSEEHTSELQSNDKLVCRLLLEKKKKNNDACTIIEGHTEGEKVHGTERGV